MDRMSEHRVLSEFPRPERLTFGHFVVCGPARCSREEFDSVLAEERERNAAERAAVLTRRQARRDRRRPSSEIHLPVWNSPTLPR